MSALPQFKKYTYSDYCKWDDSQRLELIEGIPNAMSPAPNRKHQSISIQLLHQLTNYLESKSCEVFHAPFDVRLNADIPVSVLVDCVINMQKVFD